MVLNQIHDTLVKVLPSADVAKLFEKGFDSIVPDDLGGTEFLQQFLANLQKVTADVESLHALFGDNWREGRNWLEAVGLVKALDGRKQLDEAKLGEAFSRTYELDHFYDAVDWEASGLADTAGFIPGAPRGIAEKVGLDNVGDLICTVLSKMTDVPPKQAVLRLLNYIEAQGTSTNEGIDLLAEIELYTKTPKAEYDEFAMNIPKVLEVANDDQWS